MIGDLRSVSHADRISRRRSPDVPVPSIFPDLAIEVISPGNTREEMADKLNDYFTAGASLVWYVHPRTREVHVYTSPQAVEVLREGPVTAPGLLPGFELSFDQIFHPPGLPRR